MANVLPPGKIIGKYIGSPHKLGGNSVDGVDCLSFFMLVHKERRFDVPIEFEGVTLDSYVDLWNENKDKANRLLTRYLICCTDNVNIEYILPGDIIFFDNNGISYPAIWMANNVMVTVDGVKGVIVESCKGIEILMARRWKIDG